MNPDINFQLLASADYGDGFVILLYRTRSGKYFVAERTSWGKTERIRTLDREKAIQVYTEFPEHKVQFEEAFEVAEE